MLLSRLYPFMLSWTTSNLHNLTLSKVHSNKLKRQISATMTTTEGELDMMAQKFPNAIEIIYHL
jgi:hypothetical protein